MLREVVTEINDLDPGTIESVNVIKDPDDPVSKKYNAADGGIIIKTKDSGDVFSPQDAKKEEQTNKPSSDEEVFYVVEDMPEFRGGTADLRNYIYSHLEYPENAKKKGIEGTVTVRFMIDGKGKPRNVEVLRSVYKGFDEPAMKVIREMPDWKPGSQRGKPVNVWLVLSIKFDPERS